MTTHGKGIEIIISPVLSNPRRLYTINYALLREHIYIYIYVLRVGTGCQLPGRCLVNVREAACFTLMNVNPENQILKIQAVFLTVKSMPSSY